eukprot:365327-Chlamydomonas_euryale.AAC.5
MHGCKDRHAQLVCTPAFKQACRMSFGPLRPLAVPNGPMPEGRTVPQIGVRAVRRPAAASRSRMCIPSRGRDFLPVVVPVARVAPDVGFFCASASRAGRMLGRFVSSFLALSRSAGRQQTGERARC